MHAHYKLTLHTHTHTHTHKSKCSHTYSVNQHLCHEGGTQVNPPRAGYSWYESDLNFYPWVTNLQPLPDLAWGRWV